MSYLVWDLVTLDQIRVVQILEQVLEAFWNNTAQITFITHTWSAVGPNLRPETLLTCDVKGSPYSITEHRVPELIPVLGSQPAGDVNHKPDGRLPLLSTRPAVTPATLKRATTNFAAW